MFPPRGPFLVWIFGLELDVVLVFDDFDVGDYLAALCNWVFHFVVLSQIRVQVAGEGVEDECSDAVDLLEEGFEELEVLFDFVKLGLDCSGVPVCLDFVHLGWCWCWFWFEVLGLHLVFGTCTRVGYS